MKALSLLTPNCCLNSLYLKLTFLPYFQKRNKPKEPPKAPKTAPFFLPTTQELVPKFISTEDEQPNEMVTFFKQQYGPQKIYKTVALSPCKRGHPHFVAFLVIGQKFCA